MVVLSTERSQIQPHTAFHQTSLYTSPLYSYTAAASNWNWKLKSHTIIQLNSQNTHKVVTHIMASCAKVTQSCPTLHDPMDCSPPGSSVHGVLWARILEWVAISSPTEAFRKQVKTYDMTMPIWIQF